MASQSTSAARLRVGGFIVVIFAGFMSVFPTVVNLSDWLLHLSWKSADAEILSTRVYEKPIRAHMNSSPTYGLQLNCEYAVDSKTYSSVVWPTGTGTTMGDEQALRGFAARYAPHSHHRVLYNPQEPSELIWAPDAQTIFYLWMPWRVAAGALLLLVLLLFWKPTVKRLTPSPRAGQDTTVRF